MTPVGFSHSDISGSKPVCDSPELFAANYVLHRLLTPRHPSCALSSLTTNLLLDGLLPPSIVATRRLRSRPRWDRNLAPARPWSADAVQGRDRSSLSELRLSDSIDARFHFLKTRFRVVVYLFICQRTRGRFDHRPMLPTDSSSSTFESLF